MANDAEPCLRAPRLPPLDIDVDESGDAVPLMSLAHRRATVASMTQSLNIVGSPVRGECEALKGSSVLPDISNDCSVPISRRTSIASSTKSEVPSAPTSFLSLVFRLLSASAYNFGNKAKSLARGSRFHGWRMGVLFSCVMSSVVLCCNIAIIAVGAASGAGYNKNGISNMVVGDEAQVSRWNTALHVLINALSTILLAGSNYTMQVLNSPTRNDVDAAHAKGQWLDIGILSPRNLRRIPRKRAVLWYTLALSSIPLHLFYNSSVFKIVTAASYDILTVNIASEEWRRISARTDLDNGTKGEYFNLTNQKWSDVYNTRYLSMHGDLYLGFDRVAFDIDNEQNFTTLDQPSQLTLNTTGDQAQLRALIRESPQWIRYSPAPGAGEISVHVARVYSHKRGDLSSSVQVSLIFLVIVAFFNVLKLVVMTYVLVTDRSAYLVTLGDAAASFLEHTDPHTSYKCLLGREELLLSLGHPPNHPVSDIEEQEDLDQRVKGIWLPRPQHYFLPVHRGAKVFYTSVLLFIVTILGFAPMYSTSRDGPSGTWGWGTTSDDYLFLSASGISATATLWNAWLANMPQLLLSFCYLNVNLICTSMAGSQEWNHLGRFRKGLRVTRPHGDQRSSYFLQLPYRWSLPLIVISGALHWLLSQTFFLVRIDFFDRGGNMLQGASRSACGFSSLSLFVLLCTSLLLLGVIGFVGFRSMAMKTPIVASCSLAISAACHPPSDEINPHLARVQWGVVEQEVVPGFGHCSLSSKPVKKPKVGRTYY